MRKEERDPLTEKIIACCFKVHNALGPGFGEKVYHKAVIVALKDEGLKSVSEKEYEVRFAGKQVGKFRCDLLVEAKIVVELKAVKGIMPAVFRSQVIAYLKASGLKTGLLVNFGNASVQVTRIAN